MPYLPRVLRSSSWAKLGVRLHLDELRGDLPFRLQLGDELAFEVGDADALAVRLLQLAVTGEPVPRGLMEVEQIDVIHAQADQGLVHGTRILIFGGPELGGQKDLFPGHTALPHAAAHGALVHICVGRVDETIAHFQGFTHAVLRVRRGQHEGADADDRAGEAVVQFDGFHDAFSFSCGRSTARRFS